MWKEFKEFAFQGNVLDLAVGVIIGSSFSKIVTSTVNDLILPFVSVFTNGINFVDLKYIISPAEINNGVIIKEEVVFAYGSFLQNITDFLLTAICVFFLIKFINKIKKNKNESKEEKPQKATSEDLLMEIRDLLKEK